MNIPDKIKVGGHWIEVRKELHGRDMTDGMAQHHSWYDLIKIRMDDTSESKQAECLLHEIFEDMNKRFELNLSHQSLTTLSEVLFQTIRDSDLDFRDPERCKCQQR